MKPLSFHVGAEKELQEVRRYYEAKQPGLGDQWMEAAEKAVRQVQVKPTIGRHARFGTRQYRLQRFPYYLIFIERGVDLLLLSFMHVRRNPDYWVTRL